MQVTQNRHLPVLSGVLRVFQRGVVVGDSLAVVGADQRIVQKLTLLMGDIRNQQAEKNMQALDFCRQFRQLNTWTVQ